MQYIQLVEFNTNRPVDEVKQALDARLETSRGRRTLLMAVVAADDDRPNHYWELLEYTSEQDAVNPSAQPDVPAVELAAPNASPRPVRSTGRRACSGTWSRNGRIASRAARISRPTCGAERIASTETRIPRSRYHEMMGDVTSW